MNSTKQELIKIFPKFLDEELIKELVQVGTLLSLKNHEIIMDYGAKITMIPLLLEGKIKVFKEDKEGHELFLYFIHPGQGCAVSFSCYDKLSTVRAELVEDSKILAVPIGEMERLNLKYPSWNLFVISMYNQRFEQLLETIEDIAFHKLEERLKDYIEKQLFALETNELHFTHAQIAVELNSSREVISRLLKKLEKEGLVTLARNKIILNT